MFWWQIKVCDAAVMENTPTKRIEGSGGTRQKPSEGEHFRAPPATPLEGGGVLLLLPSFSRARARVSESWCNSAVAQQERLHRESAITTIKPPPNTGAEARRGGRLGESVARAHAHTCTLPEAPGISVAGDQCRNMHILMRHK